MSTALLLLFSYTKASHTRTLLYISFRQEAEERRNKERAAIIEARKRAEAKAREREVRTSRVKLKWIVWIFF